MKDFKGISILSATIILLALEVIVAEGSQNGKLVNATADVDVKAKADINVKDTSLFKVNKIEKTLNIYFVNFTNQATGNTVVVQAQSIDSLPKEMKEAIDKFYRLDN